MPEYFDLLQMAELDEVFGHSFVNGFKSGGLFILIAFILFVASSIALFLGLFRRRRRSLQIAVKLAALVAAAGWIGSFIGYSRASAVVAGAKTFPKPSALVEGATKMAWSAFVPTAFAIVIILIALPILITSSGRSSDGEPHDQ